LKSKLFLAILVLVLASGIATPLHADQTQPKLVIDIARTANVGQYGVVHVSDRFTIFNNGTTHVSYLDFAIPRAYRNNLCYADAKDVLGTQLSLEGDVNKTSEFYWMRVYFAKDLGLNQTYVFTVSSVLGGTVTFSLTGYEFNFTAAPVLTQDARTANVTYVAPQASTFSIGANSSYVTTSSGGYPALFHTYRPWKAYSTETFYAPYSSVNQYLLDLDSVERDIIIGNDGTLGVKERYSVHDPSTTINSLTITVPDGAYNVMAYDDVGAMWTSPENPSSPYQVEVKPRYSVGIRQNENFTFTLAYNIPQSKYLSQLNWWGAYNLTFALLDNKDDFVFSNATVRIVAPDGISIMSLKLAQQSPVSYPIQVSQDEHAFKLQGVTDETSLTFGLAFSYVPFWSALGVLSWIAGLEVVIIAFALVMRLRRGPELVVPIPVEKLREFVGLYDERLALSRELVVMEEEVGRGGLVKHEFRRRTKIMGQRLDELNKSLMEVKAELRGISARHEELMRRIDRAEAEVEASRASMNQVRSQYRSGKITRDTYETLTKDITKRIDRAEETLETTLITLREEAR
jgi:opacity protein-like surface antigen